MRSSFAWHRGRGQASVLRPVVAVAVLVIAGGSTSVASHHNGHLNPSATRVAVPPVASAVIIVRDNANGKTVHMRVGDRLELILASTYWTVHRSSAPDVLRQDGPTRLLPRPKSCSKIPGLGCVPVKTSFTAPTVGRAVITASRTSCGEALRCVGDGGRFKVTVLVVK
jgi:hypothetical protein